MAGGALILSDQEITDVLFFGVATNCNFSCFYLSKVLICVFSVVNMSEKCKVCSRGINARHVKVQCKDCQAFFHGSCVNMSEEDVKFLEEQNDLWRCDNCKKTRRASMKLESTIDEARVSNEDLVKILGEMQTESRKQFERLEAELGKSVENCHDHIKELSAKFDEQSKIIKAYEEKFDAIIQENVNLKKKVKTLETQLDDLEQYSRVNCLELNGIPETKNENVCDVIKVVGTALGMQINEDMIDACHRMGTKQEGRKRGIIVKFTRRSVKEEMLQKRKVKRNFNTHDLNFKDTQADVVYINESLSPARRRILNAARALKREKGYTFVWVKNGRIFLRKNEGDPVVVATTLEQITSL